MTSAPAGPPRGRSAWTAGTCRQARPIPRHRLLLAGPPGGHEGPSTLSPRPACPSWVTSMLASLPSWTASLAALSVFSSSCIKTEHVCALSGSVLTVPRATSPNPVATGYSSVPILQKRKQRFEKASHLGSCSQKVAEPTFQNLLQKT